MVLGAPPDALAGAGDPGAAPTVDGDAATAAVYGYAATAAALVVFVLSLVIAPYYRYSDQESYLQAYEGMTDGNMLDAFLLYTGTLGSSEIVHFLVTWVTSRLGLGKHLVMAAFNAALAFAAMRLLQRWKASVLVALALVVTNFYFGYLYFTAERLKFGFLFLVLSLLYLPRLKPFAALALLAVLSHVQILLLYASMLSGRLATSSPRAVRTFLVSTRGVVLLVLLAIPAVVLMEHTYSKFQIYSVQASEEGPLELVRIALLVAMGIWYARDRRQAVAVFAPLVLAVLLVGSTRVNMMGYFAFLYFGLQCRGGVNAGVLVSSVYFAWKSYDYVANIVRFGNGFPNV